MGRIPRLEGVARIILYQHKNFDGSGFPQDDVGGHDIPAGQKITPAMLELLRNFARLGEIVEPLQIES